MSEHLRALLSQVLALPKSERLELLDEVLNNLDSPAEVEAAWAIEIRRRREDLLAGKEELLDWADARARIHGSRQ